jgi:GntR family transcriptional regulator/MocR family aminotransferase
MQLALADFIERGHYRAHLRRMKGIYARRLAQFAEGIAAQSRGALVAAVPDGGLQTIVTSRNGESEDMLMARLAKAGIQGQPLADFHLAPERALHRGVLMGFAAWKDDEAAKALAHLVGS